MIKQDKVHIAILTYKNQNGSKIEVKGSWDNWNVGYQMNQYANCHFLYLNYFILYSRVEGNLYKVWIEVPAGKHEYKFMIDGNWHLDPLKDVNENHNHVIETSGTYKLYQNITPARRSLNYLHQKVCEEYPEFYVYQPVILKLFVFVRV